MLTLRTLTFPKSVLEIRLRFYMQQIKVLPDLLYFIKQLKQLKCYYTDMSTFKCILKYQYPFRTCLFDRPYWAHHQFKESAGN